MEYKCFVKSLKLMDIIWHVVAENCTRPRSNDAGIRSDSQSFSREEDVSDSVDIGESGDIPSNWGPLPHESESSTLPLCAGKTDVIVMNIECMLVYKLFQKSGTEKSKSLLTTIVLK